jgi:hypothetical protein
MWLQVEAISAPKTSQSTTTIYRTLHKYPQKLGFLKATAYASEDIWRAERKYAMMRGVFLRRVEREAAYHNEYGDDDRKGRVIACPLVFGFWG